MTAYLLFECSDCGQTVRIDSVSLVTAHSKLKQWGWTMANDAFGLHYCPKCTKIRHDAMHKGITEPASIDPYTAELIINLVDDQYEKADRLWQDAPLGKHKDYAEGKRNALALILQDIKREFRMMEKIDHAASLKPIDSEQAERLIKGDPDNATRSD